jgi:hypothetical protein
MDGRLRGFDYPEHSEHRDSLQDCQCFHEGHELIEERRPDPIGCDLGQLNALHFHFCRQQPSAALPVGHLRGSSSHVPSLNAHVVLQQLRHLLQPAHPMAQDGFVPVALHYLRKKIKIRLVTVSNINRTTNHVLYSPIKHIVVLESFPIKQLLEEALP